MPSKRFTGFFDRRGFKVADGSIVRIRHLLESQTAVVGGPVEYKVFWDGKRWKVQEIQQDATANHFAPPKVFDLPADNVEFEVVCSSEGREAENGKD